MRMTGGIGRDSDTLDLTVTSVSIHPSIPPSIPSLTSGHRPTNVPVGRVMRLHSLLSEFTPTPLLSAPLFPWPALSVFLLFCGAAVCCFLAALLSLCRAGREWPGPNTPLWSNSVCLCTVSRKPDLAVTDMYRLTGDDCPGD